VKKFFRWFGAAFGLVAFIVLVVIAWGTGLPMYHAAACSAIIDRNESVLFDTIENDAESPAWRTDVLRVVRLTDPAGKPLWVETDAHGSTVHYLETETSRADGRIVRVMDAPSAPYGGQWVYTFRSAEKNRTELAIRETGTIYNPVFRFAARYFFGYTSRMQDYIQDLGRKFGQTAMVGCSVKMSATPFSP
jgi:hypothetical protein